jgi:phospholipid/cholesterol/gamma-HCH transport system substrate-binding protein
MRREVKIGILTLVVFVIFVWGYQFLKGKNVFERNNTFYIRYENVDQLEVASPVLVNGFKVGSVIKIKIDPEDYTKLIVTIDVNEKIKVPKNSMAIISSSGLVGGKVIMIDIKGFCDGNDCAQNGDFLKGEVLSMLGSMLPQTELDIYFKKLSSGLIGVVDSLKNDKGGDRIIRDTKTIISNLSSITSNLNVMIKGNEKNLTATFDNIQKLTQALKSNDAKINAIISNINSITGSLKKSGVDTLVEDGKRTISSLNQDLEKLEYILNDTDQAVKKIDGILADVEGGKGTLGKLIKDDKLYEDLNMTVKHTNLLLQDLRLYPGRYFNLSLFKLKKPPYQKAENDPAFEQK